jgi:methylglutaconyl-CoA hydratase
MIAAEPRGDVLVIRLDRAEKRNALTPSMLAGLVSHLDTAWSARAVVLCGSGGVFCAGFDLVKCRDEEGVLAELLQGLSRAMRAMRAMPCPVVAAVEGSAIAGGCALLSACDVVVSHRAAMLGYPVLRIGVSPAVSSALFAQSVGHGRTRMRQMSGQLMTGAEALAAGLVHECVGEAAEVVPRAMEIAEALARKPRHAVAYTKHFLNGVDDAMSGGAGAVSARMEEGLAASMSVIGEGASGEEQRALLRAFLAARG